MPPTMGQIMAAAGRSLDPECAGLLTLESLGVISTGRYGAWNYSSMEDALGFGAAAAERSLVRT